MKRHFVLRAVGVATALLLTPVMLATSDGYSIGLNFGADEPDGAATGTLAATDVAGVPGVEQGNWNRIVDGDVAVLDGSRSMFFCRMPAPELERRCVGFDIHPTGPLPGEGGRLLAERVALEIETAALAGREAVIFGLASAGLEAARRSLRLCPAKFEWAWEGSDLVLSFELPAGGYATSVLRELVSTGEGTISEGS